MKRSTLLTLLVIVMSPSLFAQPVWVGAQENHALTFEWQKPVFDDNEGLDFFASTVVMGYRIRTSEALTFVADLPFSNYDTEAGGDFLLGNPYIGLAFGSEDSKVRGDVGVRLPIADKDKGLASIFGFVSDLDRLESFSREIVPVVGLLRFQTYIPASKLGIRAHLGPSILVYTNDRGNDDMTVYLKYGIIWMYKEEKVMAQIGFTGAFDVSADNSDFDRSATHQLGLTFNGDVGAGVWPGLLIRVPLDEWLSNSLDAVIGVNVLFMID